VGGEDGRNEMPILVSGIVVLTCAGRAGIRSAVSWAQRLDPRSSLNSSSS